MTKAKKGVNLSWYNKELKVRKKKTGTNGYFHSEGKISVKDSPGGNVLR